MQDLLGPYGLMLQASTFDRRDVECGFASAAQQGVTGEEIEVRNLNAAARALMEDEGRLGPARLKLPGGEFAAGDRRRTCQGGQDRLRPLAEPAVHANLRS